MHIENLSSLFVASKHPCILPVWDHEVKTTACTDKFYFKYIIFHHLLLEYLVCIKATTKNSLMFFF